MGIWDAGLGPHRHYRGIKGAMQTKAGVLSVATLALLLPLRREPGRGDGFELAGNDLFRDDALVSAATDGFETRRGEGTASDDVRG